MLRTDLARRTAAVALAAAAALTTATACAGSSGGNDDAGTTAVVTYAPAAYGVPGHCYYIDYPAEATALIAAGLCPSSWVATQAPLSWEEEYDDYYSSPAYYTRYVPAAYRTVYVRTETTFRTTYRVQIASASKSATYKGSNGTTVTGSAPTLKFTSGSGQVTTNGGGSLRVGSTARPTARATTGSSGGGSLRTGPTARSTGGSSSLSSGKKK